MNSAKTYSAQDIRNVAIVGHSHCGKTALAEAILFDEGATTRLGKTLDGTSSLDLEAEEVHRGGSITSHFGWVEHGGKKINFIDTPGDQNFFLEGLTSLLGADSALVVVSASDGVQLQTRRSWAAAVERELARVVFVNKMDRFNGSWSQEIEYMNKALNAQLVPVQIPVGKEQSFCGVVDLFELKLRRWVPDGSGRMKMEEIPAELKDEVEAAHSAMFDAIASTDDELLEKYLETNDMTADAAKSAFTEAVKRNRLVPVLFGSAAANVGIQPLLDLIATTMPSPVERGTVPCKDAQGNPAECAHNPADPFLAQVIHTSVDEHTGQLSVIRIFSGGLSKDMHVLNASTREDLRLGTAFVLRGKERIRIDEVVCGDIVSAAKLKNTHTNNTLCAPNHVRLLSPMTYPKPMMSYVLITATRNDDDKLKAALEKLIEEDPTLSISVDDLTHKMILSGMGHGHLENAIERLRRKFQVNVTTDLPAIPYRETFEKAVQNIEGKHKKQTGGAGQFGVCVVHVEPLPRGKGFEFVDEIYGGAIPRNFIPSVEKGIKERSKHGLLAGYPLVDFRVRLVDGKHHPVDSKDIAFQMAGVKALKLAMQTAGLKLLEPYYKMEIVVPAESSGAIMGDINTRRGHVDGMDNHDGTTVIYATCPLSEIQRYVSDLHTMTAGKGTFMMEFHSFKDVPGHLVDRIQKSSPYLKEAHAAEE
ncbi:MAG TPA: elongation factor G [Bdellovibrionota bacterium]|nr:elongation factor G [Bdellovibrionota bacterium]